MNPTLFHISTGLEGSQPLVLPSYSTMLGIGLALAWRIVRQHDGAIEVRSAPDKKTTFTVRIPLQTATRGPAS